MTTQDVNLDAQAVEDAKRLKRIKVIYPLQRFLAALVNSCLPYVNFFYTNIFMFSVTFTATMQICSDLVSSLGTPLFSAFLDRVNLKKAKFWPWMLTGSFITSFGTILIMCLPFLTGKTVELMGLVFAIRMVLTIISPMSSAPSSAMYPRLSKDPADRQYFALAQKIGRDGGKTVFGYIVPLMLIFFSGGGKDSTPAGYAITSSICYTISFLAMAVLCLFGLRGSYIEREAMADTTKSKKDKVPFTAMLKVILSNRPIAGISVWFILHKIYYMFYLSYAVYMFRYVFQDISKQGFFMSVFSLSAVIGVLFGPLVHKIFKDTKKDLVFAYAVHLGLQIVLWLTFDPARYGLFLGLFACSSFFMGMLETWILPCYAACAEYGAWVGGVRMDALAMSIYTLSLRLCNSLTTVLAAAILNSIDYTNWLAKYNAGEIGVTDTIVKGLTSMFTIWPVILASAAILVLIFIYNLNDGKLNLIQQDLKEGKTRATSTLGIK